MRLAGAKSDRFFIQANGWDETREWGAPDMTTEGQFDRIWEKPVMRGLQMIQPDGYDWSKVYARLDQSQATYAEVYLPSFWQVPGPAAQYNHNTEARITQLETEIKPSPTGPAEGGGGVPGPRAAGPAHRTLARPPYAPSPCAPSDFLSGDPPQER